MTTASEVEARSPPIEESKVQGRDLLCPLYVDSSRPECTNSGRSPALLHSLAAGSDSAHVLPRSPLSPTSRVPALEPRRSIEWPPGL
jgi:hypothetical protein